MNISINYVVIIISKKKSGNKGSHKCMRVFIYP